MISGADGRNARVGLQHSGVSRDHPTVQWAIGHLRETFARSDLLAVPTEDAALTVVAEISGTAPAESFALARPGGNDAVIAVSAPDPTGLAYGLLELADIAECAPDPYRALAAVEPMSVQPAVRIRGISRMFSSEIQDKTWFYDRDFWTGYLTELAVHRVNWFQLGLGMQYNYSHDVARDNYLYFAYPFLVDVPDYPVTVEGVDDSERTANLETLRFVSDECKRRGMHFQLGLWNHAYEMIDGPPPRHRISGLTPDNHAPYCAAALARLLNACPSIDGITVRVHYEGGIPEPGHDFWRRVFPAVKQAGRPITIDMHAKGVDDGLIQVAEDSSADVLLSPKYCAEHRTLPYHQTAIRDLERQPGSAKGLSRITQERRFTRYGYGDFLREDRAYGIVFRIWPSTQRLLLWGDPAIAAGYGRLSTIGGALGVELCEPLTFRGRHDTGTTGTRDAYADPALQLGVDDWKKYRYTYRLWGRLLYDPEARPESWRRYLRQEFGAGSLAVEAALGAATRILPLVTLVHALGASHGGYWPELYVNMPIAADGPSGIYGDTAEPRTFGSVSPFDPALFARVDDEVDDLLAGRASGRYLPSETARWLVRLAGDAETALAEAKTLVADPDAASFRRLAIDVTAQAGLGRFFAAKNEAGVYYGLYRKTGDAGYLDDAIARYETARAAYAAVAEVTRDVYVSDIAFGAEPTAHGHWADRLPAIDADLAALRRERDDAGPARGTHRVALPTETAPRPDVEHTPVTVFTEGKPVTIDVVTPDRDDLQLTLHYRHLNQSETIQQVPMTAEGSRHRAVIPGTYTDAPYSLLYYVVLRSGPDRAWLWPGLDESLAGQPYLVVRRLTDG